MNGLPKTTEVGRRLPKEKLYGHAELSAEQKKNFAAAVKAVYWRNKISAATTNLAPGKTVTEIEIFELRLAAPDFDAAFLRAIDGAIPYHNIFLVTHEGKVQVWAAVKTIGKTPKKEEYYHTAWVGEDAFSLTLEGLSLDAAYEHFLRGIAGTRLEKRADETLAETAARDGKRQKLLRDIEKLKAKIRKEPQLNRQMEMNAELKRLQKELEKLS